MRRAGKGKSAMLVNRARAKPRRTPTSPAPAKKTQKKVPQQTQQKVEERVVKRKEPIRRREKKTENESVFGKVESSSQE